MPLVKILKDFNAVEGWQVDDVVDITNPERLINEGKVKLYVKKPKAKSEAKSVSVDADESTK